MESIFDIAYLVVVITLGLTLVKRSGRETESCLVGIMAMVLGLGDAFHLIPRVYALNAGGFEAHAALLGILMIVLFFRGGKFWQEHAFKWMWVAILLSFGFYAPVVLWANVTEPISLVMIPKMLAYVWIVWMGYQNFRERLRKSRVRCPAGDKSQLTAYLCAL